MKKLMSLVCVLLLLLTAVPVYALSMGADYSGDWACFYVDFGDGVLLTEYEGQNLQEMMQMQLNSDGTFLLDSFGTQVTGTWQPTGGGVALIADGIAVAFSYQDDMLVNTDEGVTMYFGRPAEPAQQGGLSSLMNLGKPETAPAFDFTGDWKCVSYVASGYSYDINMFFPDGLTMVLNADGTGIVQITPDYAENITWEAVDGSLAINGSYLLYNPVWDEESGTLSMNYAADIVSLVFEKSGEDKPVTTTLSTNLPQVYICDYFTAAFPESWVQDEYNTYNWSQYFSAQYNLKDDSGWAISSVLISVSIEDVSGYRSGLNTLLEYAADSGSDTLDEITIGGLAFQGTTYGEYWIYSEYYARVPEASVTVHVTISDPENCADVLEEILASIAFTYPIPNPPLQDPPLPEDGVPYQPSPTTLSVDGFDLHAEWLTTESSILPKDDYSNSIAVLDGTVYILSGHLLYSFTQNGTALTPTLTEPVDLDDDYQKLSATWDGTLYITDGFYSALIYRDGAYEELEMDGYLAMHPDGQWGLCYWSSYDVKKITFTTDGVATKNWALTDLSDDAARKGRFSSINYIQITSDYVFVAGMDPTADYVIRIAMYDFDGNELAVFGSEDWLDSSSIGSVAGIVQTNNGILVMDSYDENFKLFALDGTFLGLIDCDDLLGTNYPWPVSLTASENGALAMLTQKRDDGSAVELLVFELTGF